MWFVSGRTDSRTVFPIHDFVDNLDPFLVEAEPVVDTLIGSDIAGKDSLRNWAINGANNGYEIMYSLASDEPSEQVVADAKKLFFKCIMKYDADPFNKFF